MATAKKAPVKKAPVKKAPARKAAPKAATKTAASKKQEFSIKQTAEKAINIYLGVIGKGLDTVQENVESARKENDKRVKELEKRGAALRVELNARMDKIDVPEFDSVVDDMKEQINKLQDQLEDAVDTVKERMTPAKKAA